MSTFEEILRRVRDASEAQHVQAICEAVSEGMAPFNPVSVELSLISNYGYPRELRVEAFSQRGNPCLVDISDPDSIHGTEILDQIRAHFRSRRIEPEEHIQLGLE